MDTMSGSFAEPGGGGGTASTINLLEDSELSNIVGSFEPLKDSVNHTYVSARKYTDSVDTTTNLEVCANGNFTFRLRISMCNTLERRRSTTAINFCPRWPPSTRTATLSTSPPGTSGRGRPPRHRSTRLLYRTIMLGGDYVFTRPINKISMPKASDDLMMNISASRS